MAEYVEFKVMTLDKQTTIQEGFVDMSTINDDEPVIKFYDEYGVETFQPRKNPYQFHDPKFQVWEDTMLNWIVDEFYPEIIKYQDENKTLTQEGYCLVINEGAKMEVEITSIWDLDEFEFEGNHRLHSYWNKCIFTFNRENLAKIIGNQRVAEMIEEMQGLYDFENGYLQKGAIFMEMPKDIDEDDEGFIDDGRKEEIIEEYLEVAKEHLAKHLTEKHQIGVKFGDMLEQALDSETDDKWLYKFLNVNEEDLRELLISEGYEIGDEK